MSIEVLYGELDKLKENYSIISGYSAREEKKLFDLKNDVSKLNAVPVCFS